MLKLETTKTVSSRIIIVIWSSSFWVNNLLFFSSKLISSPALNGRASIELGSLSFKKEIFGVQRFKSNWYDSPASFCRGLWCKSGLKICSPHHKFRNEPHTQPLSSSSHFKIMVRADRKLRPAQQEVVATLDLVIRCRSSPFSSIFVVKIRS